MSDRDFVNKFLTLATINPTKLASNYQKPLQEVECLGVALPALRYKYDSKKVQRTLLNESNVASTVELTLKSIRTPKFSLKENFRNDTTVLQLKEFIMQNESSLQQINQLKLLLKGKVLHDSTLLMDLSIKEKAIINVMISEPVVITDPEIEPIDIDISTKTTQRQQSENINVPWDKIETLLQNTYSSNEHAVDVLKRLQKGWDLATK